MKNHQYLHFSSSIHGAMNIAIIGQAFLKPEFLVNTNMKLLEKMEQSLVMVEMEVMVVLEAMLGKTWFYASIRNHIFRFQKLKVSFDKMNNWTNLILEHSIITFHYSNFFFFTLITFLFIWYIYLFRWWWNWWKRWNWWKFCRKWWFYWSWLYTHFVYF